MNPRCALVAWVLLASSGQAQNLFEIYPDAGGTATTFTSRFSLGTGGGETLQEIQGDDFDRVGSVSTCGAAPHAQVVGYRHRIQDQDASTQEPYWIVFRRAHPGGLPPGPGSLLHQHLTLVTPLGAAGPQAWLITVHFTVPVEVPQHETWYMGQRLNPNSAWPADGLSHHCATYYDGVRGDHPRGSLAAPMPHRSWQIDSGGIVATPATPRVLRVGVLTFAPTLNAGCIAPANTRQLPAGSPGYGAGGSFPAVFDPASARFDDLAFRVRAADHAGGIAVLYTSFLRGPGLVFCGITGTFALDGGNLVNMGSLALAGGEGERVLTLGTATGSLRHALLGTNWQFQAIVVNAAGLDPRFTNLVTVHF